MNIWFISSREYNIIDLVDGILYDLNINLNIKVRKYIYCINKVVWHNEEF